MARCTWDDGRGNWGIKGVELASRDPEHASYLLMHLLEELGLYGEVPHAEA